MAVIAPTSSAFSALPFTTLKAKLPKWSTLPSLKIPPLPAKPVRPDAAPSVLHFIQSKNGGCQITSIVVGGLGGLMLTLKALRSTKSEIEEEDTLLVKLPE